MEKRLNRAKAIREKCLDCCCGNSKEVSLCPSKECPLWRYRRGTEEKDELYFASHSSKKTMVEEDASDK